MEYKRYFSIDSMKKYAHKFDEIVCDNHGTIEKDGVIVVNNLIRFIGKKPE